MTLVIIFSVHKILKDSIQGEVKNHENISTVLVHVVKSRFDWNDQKCTETKSASKSNSALVFGGREATDLLLISLFMGICLLIFAMFAVGI